MKRSVTGRPRATTNKTKKDQCQLPIGGSELRSAISIEKAPEQRSVGQNGQSKTKDSFARVFLCVKCDTAIFCAGEITTPKPPALPCHHCKLSFNHRSSEEMEKLKLRSSHRLEAENLMEPWSVNESHGNIWLCEISDYFWPDSNKCEMTQLCMLQSCVIC